MAGRAKIKVLNKFTFFFLSLYHSNSFFLSTLTICSHSTPLIVFSCHIHPSSHSPSSTSSHHYPFLHSPSSTFTFPHIYHSLPSPTSSTFNICHIHPLQSLPFFITLFTFILQCLSPSLSSTCIAFYIHLHSLYFHPRPCSLSFHFRKLSLLTTFTLLHIHPLQ